MNKKFLVSYRLEHEGRTMFSTEVVGKHDMDSEEGYRDYIDEIGSMYGYELGSYVLTVFMIRELKTKEVIELDKAVYNLLDSIGAEYWVESGIVKVRMPDNTLWDFTTPEKA